METTSLYLKISPDIYTETSRACLAQLKDGFSFFSTSNDRLFHLLVFIL